VANGKPSSNSPGSLRVTVDVICNEGYSKVGTLAVCQRTGQDKAAWTNAPACEEISCHYKTIPNSDREKDGITGKVNDAVAVTCDGTKHSFAIMCVAVNAHKAAWTSHLSCPAVKCPPVPTVENGMVGETDVVEKTTVVHYKCKDGYKKNGHVAICSIAGGKIPAWENIPTCTVAPCGALVVSNSNMKRGHDEDSRTRDKVKIDVICDKGYVGKGTAVCVPDGPGKSKWTNVTTCKPVSCGPLKVENSNHHEGKKIGFTNNIEVVECNDGYSGAKTYVLCSGVSYNVSNWFGAPTCKAASCPGFTVKNATSVSAKKVGDTVDLTCNKDLMQVGASATCKPDGPGKAVWSTIPKCEEAFCGPLVVPYSNHKNGDKKKTKPSSTANVVCDKGYGEGRGTAVCVLKSSKTSWENVPTCQPSSCGPLKVAGSKSHSDGSIEGVLDDIYPVQCADGYIGSPTTVTCTRRFDNIAQWVPDPSSIKCTPAKCPALNVKNGKVSSTSPSKTMEAVNITCDHGYKQVGGTSAICSPDGPGKSAWKDIPTCEVATCDPLVVAHGKASSTSKSKITEAVDITCDIGYVKSGASATCTATSKGAAWNQIPTCAGIPCGPLVVPNSDHKDGHNKDSKTSDVVKVTCDQGYTGGFSTASCIADGPEKSKWINLPKCQPVECPPLTVENGKASSSSPSKTMETVDITCNYGYKKFGTRAICSPDGPGKAAWKNIPICAAVLCPLKKIPNSDKADGITGKFGDVVAVKCNGATHAFAVTCTTIAKETAVWSGFVSCPETPVNMCPPLIVDHGKASSTSPSKVTEATEIICDHGYKKVGTRAVCSSAGSGKVAWTNIPTCAAVSCIEKKIPNSDKADGITGKVNQKVMVTCNGASEPFAVLCIGIGPEKAIWTGVAPCPVATCPVLSVDNGKASSSSPSKKMEIVDITCDDGYKSVGGTSATCIPSDSTDPMKVEWDQIPRSKVGLQAYFQGTDELQVDVLGSPIVLASSCEPDRAQIPVCVNVTSNSVVVPYQKDTKQ